MKRTEEIAAKALAAIGDDRYQLSLLVAKRAEAIANGAKILTEQNTHKLKPADIALIEIADGLIGIEAFEPVSK